VTSCFLNSEYALSNDEPFRVLFRENACNEPTDILWAALLPAIVYAIIGALPGHMTRPVWRRSALSYAACCAWACLSALWEFQSSFGSTWNALEVFFELFVPGLPLVFLWAALGVPIAIGVARVNGALWRLATAEAPGRRSSLAR